MTELPPLDADVMALLRSERQSVTFTDERREALLERVERNAALVGAIAGVGIAAGVGATASTWLGRTALARKIASLLSGAKAATVVVAFVAGGVAGGAVTKAIVDTTPASVVAPVASAPTPVVHPSPITKPPIVVEAPAPSASETAPVPSASAPAVPSGHVLSTLEEERTWVDRGRAALARGDTDAALRALHEHELRFPAGSLAEERDVLVVRTLVASGRESQARAKLDVFKIRHPNSVFLPSLERSLKTP